MKKAIKLTAAALAATLSLSLAACGSSASTGTASTSASADGVVYRTLDEIKADGTINIGVFSDKNPFGCRPARSMSFWPTSRSRRSAPRRSILRCPT